MGMWESSIASAILKRVVEILYESNACRAEEEYKRRRRNDATNEISGL